MAKTKNGAATTETISAAQPQRHRWEDDGSRPRTETPSGCEEHERKCVLCGVVKITVHAPDGYPYRAWRSRDGTRWTATETPLCEPAPALEVAPNEAVK